MIFVDMGEELITIDTDAAFMNTLGETLSKAFSDASVKWEGPLREADIPPDAVQWVFAGTQAFFTITGGARPAIDYFRAFVDFLRNGYQGGRDRRRTLRPTVMKFHGKEVIVDGQGVQFKETKIQVPLDDPDIAERIIKAFFE